MNTTLLEALTQVAGTPGREHRIRAMIEQEIEGLFDSVQTDPLGSLICTRGPRAGKGKKKASSSKTPLKVMLAAHMDQIGFMVNHIDDKGFVRIVPTGGFDTRNLFARACRICPDLKDPGKDIPGVLNPGGKPVHVASAEDRKKVPELHEFYVDLGLDSRAVRKKVKVGDMVVLDGPMRQVGQTLVSQAMDNRIACWVVIEAMRKLEKTGHSCEVVAVFTSQEEVGLRGAMASAYTVNPDVGVAIDTTLCIDTPGVPEEQRCSVLGGGCALDVIDGSAIADLGLVEQMEKVAKKYKIKTQRTALPRGGTDQGGIQRTRGGARTITLSVPTRYIHTVSEMISADDLKACCDLTASYLAEAK